MHSGMCFAGPFCTRQVDGAPYLEGMVDESAGGRRHIRLHSTQATPLAALTHHWWGEFSQHSRCDRSTCLRRMQGSAAHVRPQPLRGDRKPMGLPPCTYHSHVNSIRIYTDMKPHLSHCTPRCSGCRRARGGGPPAPPWQPPAPPPPAEGDAESTQSAHPMQAAGHMSLQQ